MKASEMTNEELSSWLETAPDGDGVILHGVMRETAERLRNVTVRSDNSEVIAELQEYLKANSIGAKAMREEIAILRNMITDLRAKLKLAEDALKWCLEQSNESFVSIKQAALSKSMAGCVRRCENALSAIREEGGAR